MRRQQESFNPWLVAWHCPRFVTWNRKPQRFSNIHGGVTMPQFIGAVLVVLLGLLVLWWARASQRGTLRQQWIFGYRTALTLHDKNAWITVHKATAPYLYIGGFGATGAGVVAGVLTVTEFGNTAAVLLGVAVGWVLLWVIVSFFPAAAAARAYKRATSEQS
ncbi:SdpI family protein [Microbacterium sp. CBA3102]|nr:SdpI family protein [Microbacterium sp. CBA3102]